MHSLGAAAYRLLVYAGAPFLGAAASGAVAVLLAGEATGNAYLRSLGAVCLAHSDLRLVVVCTALLRYVCCTLRMALRGVTFVVGGASRALVAAARHCRDVAAALLAATLGLARRLLHATLRAAHLAVSRVVVRPLLVIWNSPAAAL